MQIFQRNILNKYTESLDAEMIEERYKRYSAYFLNPEIQENIHQSKEEQFQEGFLRELFVKVLGYTLNPSPNYNLITEQKNEGNSKKADGAILVNGKVMGVIELKDHKTTDLSQIETQAFGYKNRNKEAIYVVISNFEKLRFYIDNAVDFEEFDLFHLTKEDFVRLWICLAYENIEKNLPKQIKAASLTNEDQITNALYKDYSNFKRDLFDDILQHNPNTCLSDNGGSDRYDSDSDKGAGSLVPDGRWELLLFKKTQKLLDRLLFIFFAEDRGLLPPNSIMLIINQWEKLKELDEYQPFYNRLKKYFGYMNTGFQGKNYEVFAYNGGLFKPDEILDGLTISDDVLRNYCKKIADYDFASDVDVNILGHIFENSLTEIEEVTTRLSTMGHAPLAQPLQKRKKDGVFYTPQYITKYIVENTVGKLCKEKKTELGIDESEYFTDKKRQTATKKALIEKLDAYREWLLQISICDPACGSGAFLNAALNFLIAEHKLIDEMSAKVEGAAIVFPNIENSILENNLYGVDINEESVEIAKLSLWLRTAKPHRKLNSLNNNIKCGNSLIDDPAIAGEKAFRWEKEFPQVFREKQKKAWHITTAVHDSRTSERMVEYEVRRLRDHGTRPYPEPMLLSEEEEIIITETVSKIVREDKLNLLAYNICFDHMHLLLVCEEEEVPKIVGKIKSMTARAVNIAMGRTVPMMETSIGTTAAATREHAPLSVPAAENLPDEKPSGRGDTQCPLWTQKFGNTYIDSEEHLYNAIQYIQTNREHHDLPPLPVEYPLCVSIEEAFRPEYTGGFDVVIGNPPYVRAELLPQTDLNYYSNHYQVFTPDGDLFSYFYEKGMNLLKNNGLFGFISNTFDKTTAGKSLRNYIQNNTSIQNYTDFTEVQIFEGATTYPVILVLSKKRNADNTFPYIKIPKEMQGNVVISFAPTTQVEQQSLDCESWSFQNAEMAKVIKKITAFKTIKEQFGKCYYGVKTALNDAFFIDEATKDQLIVQDPKSANLIKPIYEGKDLQKWSNLPLKKYLICTHNGYDGIPAIDIEQYPAIKAHLQSYEPKLSNRYDKGDTPFNLRNCAYQGLFYQPKIIWGNLQNANKFSYDESGSVISAPACMLPTNNKTLLAILNSKIVWKFLTSICVVRNGGYIEVKPQYFEQIPIPPLNISANSGASHLDSGRHDRDSDKGACPLDPTGGCFPTGLSESADQMLSLNADLQHKRQRFLRRLQDNLGVQKITATLERFDELDFKAFVAELKKQKISLSLAQQDEWEDYFNQYKTDCNALSAQIAATEKEIDRMVYQLYGLTEDEIKVVEGEL